MVRLWITAHVATDAGTTALADAQRRRPSNGGCLQSSHLNSSDAGMVSLVMGIYTWFETFDLVVTKIIN